MTIKKYKIYCETDSTWERWLLDAGDPAPTKCPVNSAHTVTADSVSVTGVIGPTDVSIQNEDGSRANFPQTAGKTPIFQPSVIPAGYYFWGSGAFDDLAPTPPASGRGDGDLIALSATDQGNEDTVEGRFCEHVYILGGHFNQIGAGHLDTITLSLFASASSPEDRTTTNDGNANKVEVAPSSGLHVIVPAPLSDGAWNVDGAALEIGESNLNLFPVPNVSGAGYWNWDPTQSPSIIPVADPGNPDGSFDLFDFQIALAQQANRYPCITAGNVTPSAAIKGKKVLPHWTWKFTLHRGEVGTVKVAIRLDTARLKTT